MSINSLIKYPSHISYSKYQFNCKNCDYVCSSKSKGSRNMKVKLHRKVCGDIKEDLVAGMNKYNCSTCNWTCMMKDERMFNMSVISHKKKCFTSSKADLVARMKRMAYNKLCEDSPNKAELLLKNDAHVDAVLKLLNIKIDTKNL